MTNDTVEIDLQITTGEAAEIVQVHESSVKRWCDSGELDCDLTEGGHRRIDIESLLTYARNHGQTCDLLAFGGGARAVYASAIRMVRDGDVEPAAELVKERLNLSDADSLAQYFRYLHSRGIPCTSIFDEIVQPVLADVGHGWENGTLGVGDEHRISNVLIDTIYAFRSALREEASTGAGIAIVACLEGNRHDIGANLVRIVLETAGWNVIYLGADAPLHEVVLQQRKFSATLVCLSMAEPQVASDAIRATRLLSSLYDASRPYRLALGGQPVRWLPHEPIEPLPFQDYRAFSATAEFSEWIRDEALNTNGEQGGM